MKYTCYSACRLIAAGVYLAFAAQSQTVTATIPISNGQVLALNPVTNKIYVSSIDLFNSGTENVTVIDGATHSLTATFPAGPADLNYFESQGLAIDPVTNKIYAVNFPNGFTVIDGATNSRTAVNAGTYPAGLAVNPLTNKIYVSNTLSNTVTAIDGASNSTTTIAGVRGQLAVNPATNKIYVSGQNLTVIDGATNSITTTISGVAGSNLAVNPATNRIYVSSQGLTVIDGATNSITATLSGVTGSNLTVNPATNNIYVGTYVIDGATNTVTSLPGSFLALNSQTNQVYLTSGNNTITVIDGSTNAVIGSVTGVSGSIAAVNPVTNELYLLSNSTVTVMAGPPATSAPAVPIQVAITPLPNDQTTSSTPTFSFTATNNLTSAPVDNLLYQVDTLQGPWISAATQGSGTFSGATAPLQPGSHTLYAFATAGDEATSDSLIGGVINLQSNSPLIGSIASYQFTVVSNGKIPETVNFTGAPASAPYASSFTVTAVTNASVPAVITASGACTISANSITMITGTGTCLMAATWPGDDTYLPASATQSTVAVKAASTTVTPNIVTRPVGQYLTLTATVTGPGGPVNEGKVTFNSSGRVVNGVIAPVVNGVATIIGDATPPVGVFAMSASYNGGPDLNPSTGGATLFVTEGGTSALAFVPVTPCRVADTRNPGGPFGGPELTGGASRDFVIPNSACGIPSNAAAYSLNVTVVPDAQLNYLTIWPAGQSQPFVSTLNSDGRIKANAAIVHAGASGAVTVFATDNTHVIIDIDGYFVPIASAASPLAFYTLIPCRVADTRQGGAPFGGPSLIAGETRSFPLPSSSCSIPSSAQAYSLNITAVPQNTLGYLTTWPTGQPQPLVSTLNAPTGAITANAAIVPAGTNGSISAYVTDPADLIIDIDGYFAPPATNANWFYPLTPCRILDTRSSSGQFSGTLPVNGAGSSCVFTFGTAPLVNATVIPPGPFDYLTIWGYGQPQPLVSTLNALDGAITSNMAIAAVNPSTGTGLDVFASNPTQLIVDLLGYFAP